MKKRFENYWSPFTRLFSATALPSRNRVEIISSTLGAFVAIVVVVWGSGLVLAGQDVPLMVASMGAAAVLLFAAPDSTMSQPWPVLAGHLISAVVGVTCAKFVPGLALSAALAVSGAILAMHLTRSLHPPGGAVAMVAVIGGESIHSLGYFYVVAPVGLNVVIMLVAALVINNLVPGKSYPKR